ncbi:lipid A biosynthesis acyltransferase [Dokdonella sp.]|uniref:LpxL/LpxP family acyltransferase n=1 Tax=Dokdonella sp. TaxID=2291710 RepID=UPI001B0987EE|nr:lipid A biosynthesis acyltransferase [Dokdonella sp.]MBO9661861.1 lipid A biosynthesis acyltransferase [Dokdonella sp.]
MKPPPAIPSPPLAWPVALLYGSLRLGGRLPLRLLHVLGALLGRLLWHVPGRTRRIIERNLSLVLTQDGTKTRHARGREAAIETGKSFCEIAKIWGNDPADALGLIRETRGEALFRDALAAGRGLIVAAPHLGCWELLNYWLASQTPLAILYRAPRHDVVEPLLLKVRGALPVEQVRAEGAGVRTLYKRLAAGGVVGILPDQQPRAGEGVPAPLFGVPAATMVLLPRLAQRTGACVLFSFMERLPRGAGYRLHFLPAPPELMDPDLERACAALNRGVEGCVQLAFPQYQWAYKRWPTKLVDELLAAAGRL